MIVFYDVSKSVRKKDLYTHLNLKIGNGITLFTGPSGSGKSTIFDMITNQTVYNGKILIDGILYPENSMISSKKVSYCSNYNTLFEHESVYDNLFFCLNPLKEKSEINIYLRKYHLLHLKYEKISSLSVGQKSLIKALQTILSDSDYMLFDEITASLDEDIARLLLEDLKNLSQNKGILIASHDPLVSSYADRIIDVRNISSESNEIENYEVYSDSTKWKEKKIYASNDKRYFFGFFSAVAFFILFMIMVIYIRIPLSTHHYIMEDEIVLNDLYNFSEGTFINTFNQTQMLDVRTSQSDILFEVQGEKIDFQKIDQNQSKIIPLVTRREDITGIHQTELKQNDILISEPLYQYYCEKAEQAGIKNLQYTDLSLNGIFPVVDIFKSDRYQINFSREGFDIFYQGGIGGIDYFNSALKVILEPESGKNKTYTYSSDLIGTNVFSKLYFYSDETLELNSLSHTIRCFNQDDYKYLLREIKDRMHYYQDFIYTTFSNQTLISGRAPEKLNEIILPDILQTWNMEEKLEYYGLTVVGYYESDGFYRSHCLAYGTFETSLRMHYFPTSASQYYAFIFRCSNLKETESYFQEEGISYITYQDLYDHFWLKNMLQPSITVFVSCFLISLCYLVFVELYNKEYRMKSEFYGAPPRSIARRETKNNFKSVGFLLSFVLSFFLSYLLIFHLVTPIPLQIFLYLSYIAMSILGSIVAILSLYPFLRKRHIFRK